MKWKELNNMFDIQKRTGYILDKRIFRAAFIFIMLLWVVAFAAEGFQLRMHIYAQCPEGNGRCYNSNYQNCQIHQSWQLNLLQKHNKDAYDQYMSELYEWCNIEYLEEGESFGKKPNLLIDNFLFISLVALAIAFLINHLINNKGFRGKKDGKDSNREK